MFIGPSGTVWFFNGILLNSTDPLVTPRLFVHLVVLPILKCTNVRYVCLYIQEKDFQ